MSLPTQELVVEYKRALDEIVIPIELIDSEDIVAVSKVITNIQQFLKYNQVPVVRSTVNGVNKIYHLIVNAL